MLFVFIFAVCFVVYEANGKPQEKPNVNTFSFLIILLVMVNFNLHPWVKRTPVFTNKDSFLKKEIMGSFSLHKRSSLYIKVLV